MAQSIIALDVSRSELAEPPISRHRAAKDIHQSTGGKNLVFKWPATGSFTLYPIQAAPAFSETLDYESLKLRASDFKMNPKLWQESSELTKNGVKGDYFLNMVLTSDAVPDGYPHDGGDLLTSKASSRSDGGLIDAVIALDIATILQGEMLQSTAAPQVLMSKKTYDNNQGFCLRFYQEGRGAARRGTVLGFSFGDYTLVLNTTGMAELYQTADFITYALVYSFRWADQGQVHDIHHRIIIYPHGRQYIEFLAGNETAGANDLLVGRTGGTVDRSGYGAYRVPGPLQYDAATKRFLITAAAPISVFAKREFRTFLQVSLIGYVNGSTTNNTPGNAFVIDNPITLPFAPLNSFRSSVQADANGCTLEWQLYDPVTQKEWEGGKGYNQIQFAATFFGNAKDDKSPSSATPELYGYSIKKPPLFIDITRDTAYMYVEMANITRGGSPDSEKMTVKIDDMDGQMEAFVGRSDIPVMLFDADTNVIFFEGTAEVSGEDNLEGGYAVTLECRGMAGDLHRCNWTDAAPNFGHDPDDENGGSYFWSEVVYYCFEASGMPRERVVIENLAGWDFKLPGEGDTGGTQKGKGKDGKPTGPVDKGSAHVENASEKALRWQPKWDSTPYEFLDYLLRGFLHWDFAYNTYDRCWHVFKRPIPTDPLYSTMTPVAYFFGDYGVALQYSQDNPNANVYTHQKMKYKNYKPRCTTVVVKALIEESRLLDKEALAAALKQEQTQGGTAADSAFPTAPRTVTVTLSNWNGYPNPNSTLGYKNNIDWLGHIRFRDLPTTATSREHLAFLARRAYYEHCCGVQTRTFDARWGDAVTTYFRKWTLIAIDSGRDKSSGARDGSLELYWILDVQAAFTRDANRIAGYHVARFRLDVPPPF